MKIIYIDVSIGFGGAFKSLALAWRGLSSYEKILVTAQDPDLVRQWFPGARAIGFRRMINYRTRGSIAALPIPAVFRWVMLKFFALADVVAAALTEARLYLMFRRERPDVVHLNNWFSREVQSAARRTGVPCVVHIRGMVSEPSAVEGELFSRNLDEARDALAIVAVSDAVRTSLREAGFSESIVRRIYDPVDIDAIDRGTLARSRVRAQYGVGGHQVAMGLFGRVTPWKGQEEYVRAAIEAMRAVPSLVAFIVGDQSHGTRDYFDRVRAIIAASGFSDRFVLTGYRANVEELYAAMDILVHASTSPEPFGMVVIEGMAASLPVIATAGGGPVEVVSPGVDGLLVQMGDVPSLSEAMVTLASDPDLRRRMGASGRSKAVQTFGIDAHAARIAAVYDAVGARG
jgi:glycosyltransferase involved in cell wall biosynthesis